MKKSCFIFSIAAVLSSFAAPLIDQSEVKLEQDTGSRLVSVTYTLKESPGVITVDFQTNALDDVWVSIGEANFTNVAGDVNKLIAELDVEHRITWQPLEIWPDRRISGKKFRAVVTAWATNSPPDYMVIDLLKKNGDVSYYVSKEAMPFAITDGYCKTNSLVMRRIHAAHVTWIMGPPVGEAGRNANEEQHCVTLSKDYYMGIYEFTKGQFYRIRGTFKSSGYTISGGFEFPKPAMPVEYMSLGSYTTYFRGNGWPNSGHSVSSTSVLQSIRDHTGFEIDLPTEAQWEYACRAGTSTAIYTGKAFSKNADAPGQTSTMSEVGLHTPNAWDLYDMYGNASETCVDRVDGNSLGRFPVCNPVGLDGEGAYAMFVRRGGSYFDAATGKTFRSARRDCGTGQFSKGFGYRLCCPAIAVR